MAAACQGGLGRGGGRKRHCLPTIRYWMMDQQGRWKIATTVQLSPLTISYTAGQMHSPHTWYNSVSNHPCARSIVPQRYALKISHSLAAPPTLPTLVIIRRRTSPPPPISPFSPEVAPTAFNPPAARPGHSRGCQCPAGLLVAGSQTHPA